MSKASEYARALASPPEFIVEGRRLFWVTADGYLAMSAYPGDRALIVKNALALAAWIVDTFGEPKAMDELVRVSEDVGLYDGDTKCGCEECIPREGGT